MTLFKGLSVLQFFRVLGRPLNALRILGKTVKLKGGGGCTVYDGRRFGGERSLQEICTWEYFAHCRFRKNRQWLNHYLGGTTLLDDVRLLLILKS